MPILSVSTFSLYPRLALSEAVRYALDTGWPGIEIWTTPQTTTPSYWDDHRLDRAALRRLAAEGQLRITVHSPGGANNLATRDPWHRRASVEAARSAIDFASEVGAAGVVVHPGTVEATATFATYPRLEGTLSFEALRQEAFRLSTESITELAGYGATRGVLIFIENLGYEAGSITRNPQDMVELLRGVHSNHARLAFDTGHASLSWGVEETFRVMAPHIGHVHINDSPGGGRRGVRNHHVELGQGKIDFAALADGLRGIAGSVVLEVVDHEDQEGAVRRSRDFLVSLLRGAAKQEGEP